LTTHSLAMTDASQGLQLCWQDRLPTPATAAPLFIIDAKSANS
jgi:hypothetical protein